MAKAKYIVFLLFIIQSAFGDEIRLGAGVNYGKLIGDGIWIQEGLDNHIDNGGSVFAVQYVGRTPISWLDYSIGGASREGPIASGQYVSDDCYNNRQFTGGQMSDVYGTFACDRRYNAKRISTKTNAITLTLNPTWRVSKDFSLSTALGISRFSSSLSMEWEDGTQATYQKRSIAYYGELTATYTNFFSTIYYAKGEHAPESMADSNYGFFLGYAIRL